MEAVEKTGESEIEETLDKIIKSGIWYYCEKNLGAPGNSLISLGGVLEQNGFVKAAKVFEAMGLDLEELSQIFVPEPWKYFRVPKNEREKQPIARSYLALGKCRPYESDFEGWVNLAKLVGKEIHLMNPDKGPEEKRG